jgi:TolB protein
MRHNGLQAGATAAHRGRWAPWLRLTIFALLVVVAAATGGCWLWEEPPSPDETPLPTATPPEQKEAGPSSPPITGRLLYASAGHIWLRTGTTAHRLTEETTGTQPAWSLDGTQVAFVVRGEYYSDIWVMDADGGGLHPITENRSAAPDHSLDAVAQSYWAAQPQWVPPEGARISYVSHYAPGSLVTSVLQVWIMHADDGGEKQRHLGFTSQNVESPVWSPDGQWLAFTLYTFSDGAQLRYMDADGNVHYLGEDIRGIQRYDPAWSPDGLWIAYAAREEASQTTDLWLMPSPLNPLFEGEWVPARLTQMGAARGPAWSPDGGQVVFVVAEKGAFDLWLLTLNASGPTPTAQGQPERLTNTGDVDGNARPSWAP